MGQNQPHTAKMYAHVCAPVLRQPLNELAHGAHVHGIVVAASAVAGRPVLGLELVHHVGDARCRLCKMPMSQLHLRVRRTEFQPLITRQHSLPAKVPCPHSSSRLEQSDRSVLDYCTSQLHARLMHPYLSSACAVVLLHTSYAPRRHTILFQQKSTYHAQS